MSIWLSMKHNMLVCFFSVKYATRCGWGYFYGCWIVGTRACYGGNWGICCKGNIFSFHFIPCNLVPYIPQTSYLKQIKYHNIILLYSYPLLQNPFFYYFLKCNLAYLWQLYAHQKSFKYIRIIRNTCLHIILISY